MRYYSGGYLIQFGLGPTELAATLGNNLATFDTSGVYHDIRVQGNFGTNANFELYVDHNILIGGTSTIATPLSDGSLPPDSLYFGDLTGGANAKADLSSYSFVQPVPITPVIHPAVEITWNSLLNVQLSTSGG